MEDLYSFILTKLNGSEMNEKKDILLKRKREEKKRPDELNKHNIYQENRKMGISTHPIENHFQN